MNATLSLHGLPDEELAELGSALLRSINQETGLTARRSEGRGGAGTRGDAVTIARLC